MPVKKVEWLSRQGIQIPFYYTVCTTEALMVRELTRMKMSLADVGPWSGIKDACCHQLENKSTGSNCGMVCIPVSDRDPIEIVGLLVHEAVHLWQWQCDLMGEKHPSIEFEAYSIQWISQQLIAEYSRQANTK